MIIKATETFNDYFDSKHTHENEEDEDQEHAHFPISFLLAFLGYTLILMIEKIVFDTHSHQTEEEIDEYEEDERPLCDMGHDKDTGIVNVNNNYHITLSTIKEKRMSKELNEDYVKNNLIAHNQNNYNNNSNRDKNLNIAMPNINTQKVPSVSQFNQSNISFSMGMYHIFII